MARSNVITIEDTKLILRNFSGKPDKFTPEGKRSFGVLISPETAEEFEEAGIPVKYLQPRHDEDEPIPWVKVKLNMDRENPPKIFTDRAGEKNQLDATTVSILDYADIDSASMQLSIYEWEFGGKSGKALYLQTLVCFLNEDDFLSKYDLSNVGD